MNYTIASYCFYVLITFVVIVQAGQTLYKSGHCFLVNVFHDVLLAESINKLLLLGYYLLNIAYVLLVLQTETQASNTQTMMELVSQKAGLIILLLAGMHFFNLFVFTLWRRYEALKMKEIKG